MPSGRSIPGPKFHITRHSTSRRNSSTSRDSRIGIARRLKTRKESRWVIPVSRSRKNSTKIDLKKQQDPLRRLNRCRNVAMHGRFRRLNATVRQFQASLTEIYGTTFTEPEDGVFYAQIGPTGGKRGYSAITGKRQRF